MTHGMAFKYFKYWLPADVCLCIDTIFFQRYYVLGLTVHFTLGSLECIASNMCASYRTIMTKYYWSFVMAFSMSMFVFLYYCFNETVSTDDVSNSRLNVFASMEFDRENDGLNIGSTAKENVGKYFTNTKCAHLYEVAMDMLYNGEKVPFPFESNDTRWIFHKRGNLKYLRKLTSRWSQPSVENSSFRQSYIDIKSRELKAKKYFITFACRCCAKAKIRALKSARDPGGFDFTTVHDLDSLSKNFRQTHSDILKHRRGCGYWLWKPYIILKTLVESMLDDDLLMYQDAGAHIVGDVGPLLKLGQELDPGIVLFHTEFLEKEFTKRDAFILMNMEDTRVYESYQRLASFLIVRKNCKSLQFIMEWLAYASDARILTDMKNQMGEENFPPFRENRHDQTVLSLLSKKWQLDEFRDPSQYGNIDKKFMFTLGPYRQLIYHSRNTT